MEHLEKVLDERNNFLEKIAINNIKVEPPPATMSQAYGKINMVIKFMYRLDLEI